MAQPGWNMVMFRFVTFFGVFFPGPCDTEVGEKGRQQRRWEEGPGEVACSQLHVG